MKELIKAGGDRVFFLFKQAGFFPGRGIRILMYHSTPAQPVSREKLHLSVSEKSLRIQLEVIQEEGYRVIGLEDAIRILKEDKEPDKNYLVLTFDDFFENNFYVALPLLEKFGLKAVFFPAVSHLDEPGFFPWVQNPEPYGRPGTRQMIREIFSLGHEIGSHTCSHPVLADLKEDELREELLKSKTILEDLIGAPVKLFSYPYGHLKSFNPGVKEKLRDLGYICGLTTLEGANHYSTDPFSLKRTAIADQDTKEIFSKKLQGVRDWFFLRQLIQGIL